MTSKYFINTSNAFATAALVVNLFTVTGCGYQPGRVSGVRLNPRQIADEAINSCDDDQSGQISRDEAEACPELVSAFEAADKDGDGQLTKAEIESLIEGIFDPALGLCTVLCHVTKGGSPLRGATVTFVPPSYLESAIPPASGVTDSDGTATLSIAKEDLPADSPAVSGLIRPGLYRVEVTHPSIKVPSKYNSATQLGQEVSSRTLGGVVQLPLKF